MRTSRLLAYRVSGGLIVSSRLFRAKVIMSRGAARFHFEKPARRQAHLTTAVGRIETLLGDRRRPHLALSLSSKSCFVVNPWRADFESPLLMGTISRYFTLSLATSRCSIRPLWACGFRWCGHHGAEEGQADGLLLPGPSPVLASS